VISTSVRKRLLSFFNATSPSSCFASGWPLLGLKHIANLYNNIYLTINVLWLFHFVTDMLHSMCIYVENCLYTTYIIYKFWILLHKHCNNTSLFRMDKWFNWSIAPRMITLTSGICATHDIPRIRINTMAIHDPWLRLSLTNATEQESPVTYGDKSHLVARTDNSQVLWFMRTILSWGIPVVLVLIK
jgi:hypothetical protein